MPVIFPYVDVPLVMIGKAVDLASLWQKCDIVAKAASNRSLTGAGSQHFRFFAEG